MKSFPQFLKVTFLSVLLFSMIGPTLIAKAAIEAADYFTVATSSSTVDAGDTVTLTISSLTTDAAPNPLIGSDFAFVEIHNSVDFAESDSDVTAIDGNMEIKPSQSTPWGNTTAANVAGTNDTLIAVNFSGDSVGTITVKAGNEDFSVFVWADGAWGGPNPPQNMQSIDVSAGSGAADHLIASSEVDSAEVGEEITYTITQVNSGGGLDVAALSDVGVALTVDGTGVGMIMEVNGIEVEEMPDADIANMTLTDGVGTVTVLVSSIGDGSGALTVTPSSTTLLGIDVVDTSVVVGAAMPLSIQGYGPTNGQSDVPTMAPVDLMFSEDPDPTGTIFPLTNAVDSVLSITTEGTAVAGSWQSFSEDWGDFTFYRATFVASAPFTDSTIYAVDISKDFVSSVSLYEGTPALTDGVTYSLTFTTGTGGGDFMMFGEGEGDMGSGGFFSGFTGDFGGEFPPSAYMSYPMPGAYDVPTNIACISVGFDREMQSSTLITDNIYIRKLVDGEESVPTGTPVVTAMPGNQSVCISGYTFLADSDYRVVVTKDVTDTSGTQISGMPVDVDGSVMSGFGFGYENMGSFQEQFRTGSGASTITASLMGVNIDGYNTGVSIVDVPTGTTINASFNAALNPATVNATNVTLKKNGTVPEPGSVFYDAWSNSVDFVPTNALSATTSYTFAISTSVTSISGTAISAVSKTFTTGVADVTKPQLVYAEADNYGLSLQFSESLNDANAVDRSFYTVKTCTLAAISSDGTSCTGGGSVTTVSLLSGINAHYDRFDSSNKVWMDGFTLGAGDGFYVGVGTGVTDVSENGMHATENKSWTGTIMDAGQFAGGQGMFAMGSIGFEDFDMGMMGMKPINAMPMNTMAGATTKYFVDVPVSVAIPSGGYIELTFPSGFGIAGVKPDAESWINNDFNGPGTGAVTFATSLPTITGLTDGGGDQANDGVGYISAAGKVIIKLSAATQSDDFLSLDLDGILNSSEPASYDTAGYSVDIKTFDTSNLMLEAMTSMPFFISEAGTASVSGQVIAGESGLNDVKVILMSPMTGPMEVTTSLDAAGTLVAGSNAGEWKFENLPDGQYFLFTEPMFTVGDTDYYGNFMPEPLNVSGATTKNISVTAATSDGKATQPISITFPDLDSVSSLGFNDSIDIFAFNPFSRIPVIKTVTRASLGASPYSVDLYLPTVGDWNIGMGPSMPKGPTGGGGKEMMGGWMPPQMITVSVAAADLGGDDLTSVTLAIGVSDKTVTGKVLDSTGGAVANAEVYAYNPQGGQNAHAVASVDGSFVLNVTEGTYKVGAFIPGLPSSQETSVFVDGASFYVDGSATASTGSSAGNPFNLKLVVPNTTIQGRVATGGGAAIAGAAVWAHRTDQPSPPLHAVTDSSGNYTLYVSAGTWKVEGDAPNYGYLGYKTLVISDTSLIGQNFEVASDLNTVSGTVDIPGVSNDGGTMVYAYGDNGSAEAITDTEGNYTLNLPDGTYDINAVLPGAGDLPPLADVLVNGTEIDQDFTPAALQTLTVTLSEAVTEDTTVDLFSTDGTGNQLLIPVGETSGTLTIPQGTYYLDAYIPGADFEDLIIAGAEFNNPNGTPVTTDQVNVDGTSDNLTITLPTLYTLTGQVTSGASGMNDVYVSIYDQTTDGYFGTMTSNDAADGGLDGEYSIKVQAGTYSISADKDGYSSTPIDKIVSASSADNDFVLAASSRTITGTVTDGVTPIVGAPVWAEQAGGGFASTETDTDGTYILNVDPGIWTVNAVAEGYAEDTAAVVDVTAASDTESFSVIELTGGDVLQEPHTETITPGLGGTVLDEGTNVAVIAPPNALGTSTESGQLSIEETNAIMATPSANPIGNAYEISAIDADENPITILGDDVLVSFPLTLAELIAEGVDTSAEVAGIANAYWDDTSGNWASLPTDCIYYDASSDVIPENTVSGFSTLTAAGVASVEFLSKVDHFTTFAPIIASGATPPATPSGLAAVAGNASVTLTWTKNSESDMSLYNIWEANVTEGILTTHTQASCVTSTCSKTISSLTNGTAYSFQIAAVDTPDGNVSAYSSAVSATPVAPIVAPSPSQGSPHNGDDDDDATTDVVDDETSDAVDDAIADDTTDFVDIVGHWAQFYVVDLFEKGIISGKDVTHYDPETSITRAEFVKIVLGAFDITVPDPSEITSSSFGDVTIDSWYAPYVQAAFENGIVTGYGDGMFQPNVQINRADAMKVLLDTAGISVDTNYDAGFSDINTSEWYASYVNYAAEHGIVSGYGDGTFGPWNSLTRAQAAKIVSLMLVP